MNFSFSAIILSIAIGVATNLLTPHVAKFFGIISASFKKRNDEKKRIFENTVKFVLEDSQEEVILRLRYLQRSIVGLFTILIAFVMMFSDNVVQVIIGFVFFTIGNYGSNKANRLGKILEEIWKRKTKDYKDINLD